MKIYGIIKILSDNRTHNLLKWTCHHDTLKYFLTKSLRNLFIECVINEVNQRASEHEISLEAVDRFPSVFNVINARKRTCCIQKAYGWYNSKYAFPSASHKKGKQTNGCFDSEYSWKQLLDEGKNGEIRWNNCIQYCWLNSSGTAPLVCNPVQVWLNLLLLIWFKSLTLHFMHIM